MKKDLFNRLNELKLAITTLETKDDAKGVLAEAAEIVHQFNKGKYQHGPEELNLNKAELDSVIGIVDEIWKKAASKNLDVWPKPEVDLRKGD